jgi:hypothetical protein
VETSYDQVRLSELIDQLEAGGSKYLRFYPVFSRHPELLEEVPLAQIREFGNIKKSDWLAAKVFLGAGGTATEIHHAMVSNLFLQVYGTKKWELWPPSASPFCYPLPKRHSFFVGKADYRDPFAEGQPLFSRAKGYVVTLKPGDVLFVPPFWWHGVQNETASVAVSFWWVDNKALFCSKGAMPQKVLCLFGSPNPILERLGLIKPEDALPSIINAASNNSRGWMSRGVS